MNDVGSLEQASLIIEKLAGRLLGVHEPVEVFHQHQRPLVSAARRVDALQLVAQVHHLRSHETDLLVQLLKDAEILLQKSGNGKRSRVAEYGETF